MTSKIVDYGIVLLSLVLMVLAWLRFFQDHVFTMTQASYLVVIVGIMIARVRTHQTQ